MQYSVGFTLPGEFDKQLKILDTADVWRPALDADQQICPDALVADAAGLLALSSWPKGMRVIVRKEKPHSGAQLRITDVNGWLAPRLQRVRQRPVQPYDSDALDQADSAGLRNDRGPGHVGPDTRIQPDTLHPEGAPRST